MTTVLLADRDGRALGPLAEKTVPALLPLRGAPVLERALEALVAAGIRSALVVVGPRGTEIEKRFGKGIRWGIALEYVKRAEDETTGAVLRRLEQRLDGETLLLRGDAAVEEAFGEFARRSAGRSEPVVAAVSGERLLGMWRVKPEALKKLEVPREPAGEDWALERKHAPLDVGLDVAPLDGLPRWRDLERGDGRTAVSPRAAVAGGAKLSGGTTVGSSASSSSSCRSRSGPSPSRGRSSRTRAARRGPGPLPGTAPRRGRGRRSARSGSRRRSPSSGTSRSSSRSCAAPSPSPASRRWRPRRRRT